MNSDSNRAMRFLLSLVLVASSEAFFLKWGSDTPRQAAVQKPWLQQPVSAASYRYQYMYSPYESHKMYQLQAPQYVAPEVPIQQSMAPIPISIPAGSSLTPVSLQHVKLVPCMCPVAPEEAEKLHEQVGPGPYLAQTYAQPTYSVAQQMPAPADQAKPADSTLQKY